MASIGRLWGSLARPGGRAIALHLATDGLAVAVHYAGNRETADGTVQSIRDGNG